MGLGRVRTTLSVVLALACQLTFAAEAQSFIYWTDATTGSIGRASSDGAGVEPDFITGANSPCGVATDGTWIYWANTSAGTIGRARLDGTQVNQSFITGASDPCGPSIELLDTQLYWANAGSGTVANAFSDGTNVNQSLFAPIGGGPLATATLASEIYWTSGFSTVNRGFEDGSGDQVWVDSSQVFAPSGGITVSATGVYWVNASDANDASIGHVDPDGSNADGDFLEIPFACGVGADETHVYWATGGTIGRALLDGTNAQDDFVPATGGNACQNIAVVPDTAEATASPSSLSFGGVQVGTGPTAAQNVTLTNSGSTSVDLAPGASALGGPNPNQFSITADGCDGQTVAPGASCTVSVDFDPTSLGGKSATLSIPSNDPESPATVQLSGSGTDPDQTVSPASIAFGGRLVGTQSAPQVVTLTNGTGATQADDVGQATLSGPSSGQFAIVSDGCSNTTVPIGESCQISVRFAPTAPAQAGANLTIPSDDPTSPATVALSGTGTAPEESVLPGSLAFGEQTLGTVGPTQSITVANRTDATGPLMLGTLSLGGTDVGQFELVFDNCSGRSLAPGQDCAVGVRFAPGTAAAFTAAVQVPSNDGGGTVAVDLSGTGISAPPPSGTFQLGEVQRKRNGTAVVPATVPGAGQLALSGKGIRGAAASPDAAGTFNLRIRPRPPAARRLRAGAVVKVVVRVVFTPTGGEPVTRHAVAKLSRR